ncbi:PepSY domain-containing protein [Deminuibacter soli]|uniref:PepSY domain-containing protein n=1 Tax=Deminuibacter soli TaxID=2291815 RepID=A0A3E1NGJ1_9BACT|nr:PepSY domain-containing protein [Deminuibacter soli]RFM27083.1 PepSY domain-containing protein [Deminuibacter soli]
MTIKQLYNWHRKLSIIIAVPVLLWATSGLMHPLMTNMRPKVKQQSIQAQAVDTAMLKVPLQQVLQQSHIDSFTSMRLVNIGRFWFYQVKVPQFSGLLYFSTLNGKLLNNGDALYARYLAKQFLEGNGNAAGKDNMQHRHMAMPATAAASVPQAAAPAAEEDCCSAASSMANDTQGGAAINNVSFVEGFTSEYKPINHLLPVYRVDFARADGIRIYVETAQSRFAFAVDHNRAAFDTFFQLFHTWSWIQFLGSGKFAVEVGLALLAFLTAVAGLYLFFNTKSGKASGNTLVKARKRHRYTAVVASVFTLMFSFSGGYHAFTKLTRPEEKPQAVAQVFHTKNIQWDFARVSQALDDSTARIANIALVQMNGRPYWQILLLPAQQHMQAPAHHMDLMKDMKAAAPDIRYIDAGDYTQLPEGDRQYAVYLANMLGHHTVNEVQSSSQVTAFTDEYGFINKRLPVWKIAYAAHHDERFFVETTSGALAAHINNLDMYEGYSFALLHKHHFMDWAGKQVRDGSTIVAASLQILLVVVGLVLYFVRKKRLAQKQA